MKHATARIKISTLAAALMLLCQNRAQANNGQWNSTSTGYSLYWTNSVNWSSSPYPSGGETATFNNGGGNRTNINVAALSRIKYIAFDSYNVASYIIGADPVNSQTMIMENEGEYKLNANVTRSQTFNAAIQLGIDRGGGNFNFRNDTAAYMLTLNGDLLTATTGTTVTAKNININGVGNTRITGNIVTNGSVALTVTDNSSGTLYLTGTNRITLLKTQGAPASVVDIGGGSLYLDALGGNVLNITQDTVLIGTGTIRLSTSTGSNYADCYVAPGKTLVINPSVVSDGGLEIWSGTGTFVLNGINDFASNILFGAAGTIVCSKIGNQGSTDSNLGRGQRIWLNAGGSRLVYTGTGETSDRILELNASATLDHSGSGTLAFSTPMVVGANTKTLTLQGSTSGTGEISAAIGPGSGTTSLAKDGAGTWRLAGANSYAGATAVNSGTLMLTGPNGAVTATSGFTVNAGGTLLLDNTAAANNTNRLRDVTVTLNGGTLRFANSGGAADYLENAGQLAVSQNNSTVATVQAAPGQAATLRFASLARTAGATVNFTGAGLGVDGRNKILFTSQANGLLGPWATVNGTNLAAYSTTLGVYAAAEPAFTDIAAYGDTIVSNDTSAVRINSEGSGGNIELSAATTRIAALTQNTPFDAIVNTSGKTLQTAGVSIQAGKASVALGAAAGDGVLTAAASGGDLALNNSSAAGLTVNAVVANNTAASSLTKSGSGAVTLASANTFSGPTTIGGGALVLAHGGALQNSTLSTGGAVFDSAVASHAFTLGGIAGSFTAALADNAGAPNPVALAVGNNNANTAYSGTLSGSGSLAKTGTGTLTLSGTNTFSGGLTVIAGQVTASSTGALGAGPVVNNGVLNLTGASDITYTGLSTGLSGYGTNNVTLGTGASTVYLHGNYAGFTGLWNIGVGAAPGAAKVFMNGADHPDATVNVMTNGTLFCNAGTHTAKLLMRGGNTGESLGQLRIEGAAIWAGPVTLAGPMTTNVDAFFGCNSGIGTVSGVISDSGGGYLVDTIGGGTLVFSGANTYAGPTWIKGGTLKVPSLPNVGATSGPLGAPDLAGSAIKIGFTTTSAILAYYGMGEQSDRVIDMAGTTGGAGLDQSCTNLWKLTGGVIASLPGNKRLTLQGSTLGTGEVASVISDIALATNSVFKNGSGTWTLSADNLFKGSVEAYDGALRVTRSGAFGVGPKTVTSSNAGTGTGPRISLDGSAGDLVFPANITFRTSNSRVGAIFNEAGNNTIQGDLNLIGGDGLTILNSVAGKLTISGAVYAPTDTGRELRFRGDGDGEISGAIANGATVALPVYRETGAGTWTLSGSNTYSGATYANSGTLVVGGANGALAGSGALTLGVGTFVVSNTAAANHANRLVNSATVTDAGGTFSFYHDGGAADYGETTGPLVISANTNRIVASQAAEGRTSTLTFASLTRNGGTVDFSGMGLGVDTRNRIVFTANPTLANGIIGPWATYNGAGLASYSASLGVIAAPESAYTNIAARGPDSVIPDNAALNARIVTDGVSGPITLEGATVSSVSTLLQSTATPAVVTTASKRMQASGLMIGAGQASLTIGEAEGDGALTSLTSGGELVLGNLNPDATLTVNAPVTNFSASNSSLSKYGAGKVVLTGSNTYSGVTVINEGALEFGGSSTQTRSGVISGPGTLAKSGQGTFRINAANTYTGPTLINEGTVVALNNASFGSSATGTVIAAGATLDIGGANQDALNLGTELFTVSGNGVGGNGAIVDSGKSQLNAFGKIALAGDTSFGGAQRFDLRNNTPTLTMNGYALTKISSNQIDLVNASVYPDSGSGTGRIDVAAGRFTLEAGTRLNGSATNTFTVRNGAQLDYYNLAANCPVFWTLILEQNSRVVTTLSYDPLNTWAGPVTLNGAATVGGDNTTWSETFSGPVSGGGALIKTGVAAVFLSNTNNTYGGTTTVSNGTLFAYHPGSLPGYAATGLVTVVGGGTLVLRAGDGTTGWSKEQIDIVRTNTAFTSGSASLGIDTTWGSLVYDRDIPQDVGLTKYGNGMLTLTGVNSNTSTNRAYRVYGGTNSALTLANTSSNNIGPILVSGGALGATLNVDGYTSLGTNLSQTVYISTVSGDRGTLIISTNMIMGKMFVGSAAGASGALIQNGGAVAVSPTQISQDVLSVGNAGGYGYFRMNGGSIAIGQFGVTGGGAGANNGVVDLMNGSISVTGNGGWLIWGWSGGNGIANLFNGTLTAPPGGNDTTFAYSADRGSFAMLNLLGPGALMDATGNGNGRGIDMARSSNNLASVVNLNAGTLLANRIRAGVTVTPTYFNFNGGTLKANAITGYGATFMQGLTAATVYPGGAVVDTTNANITVNQSLLAPAGYGVASLALRTGGAGYIGAPVVLITGGSGTGATAIASVDLNPASPTAGQVTGLTVTSPGSGYQPYDSVLVSMIGGGYTNAMALAYNAALAPNAVSGGLTKLGSGTLTLGGTNTYGGATTVSNGTLVLANSAALPTNTAVNVASGTYDLNGFTVTNGALTVSGGAIVNGTLGSGSLTKLGTNTFTLSAALSMAGPIVITAGTLQLASYKPGLYEGRVAGTLNTTSPNPQTATPLSTRYANIQYGSSAASGGIWTDSSTYIYSGYVWNNAATNETWGFAKSFDDGTLLKIDGVTLINNGSYMTPAATNYTLTPGAHPIELRLGQSSGGVGPTVISNIWTTASLGFGYDPLARNTSYSPGLSTTYQPLADPGDGSVLSVTTFRSNLLAAASSVELAADGVLNLGGNIQTLAALSGSGLVTNGTLTVTGPVAPGGTNVIGTLSIAASAKLSGALLADVAANGDSDLLSVRGNLDLSGLSLVIANPELLNRQTQYTLVTVTGTRTGTFGSTNLPDSRWHVSYLADGTVRLVFVDGTIMLLK